MALLQPGSVLFVWVLFLAASMSFAAPIDIFPPDAGLADHGADRKLLSEDDYGSPQANSPLHEKPPLKAPCSHPGPAPIDNGETVVLLDGNNAWEVIVSDGKKPPVVMPPCQAGACEQAVADVGAHHINQVDYPQSGSAPFPDNYDHPLPAARSLHSVRCIPICLDPNQVCVKGYCLEPPHIGKGFTTEACRVHNRCTDPMKLCISGRCVYSPHDDRVNKAVADELDIGAYHINQVNDLQSGPAPSLDSYDHTLPAAWRLTDILCIPECPDPMQKCINGYCDIEPPYVDNFIKGFNRGGAVLP